MAIIVKEELNKPMISIIIPTYNAAEHISETLNSIINQTDNRWECILIDDGSKDQTIEICKEIISKNKKIRFAEKRPSRKGANACRNVGIKESITKYLLFIDADDTLSMNCIETRINTIKSKQPYDLYIFNTGIVDKDNNITGYFKCIYNDEVDIICAFIKHHILWQTMSPIWRKDFLNKIGCWNENYLRLQDVELNIRAFLHKPAFTIENTPVDSYYKLTGMTQAKIINALFGFCKLLEDYYHVLEGDNWSNYQDIISESFSKLIQNTIGFYINKIDQPDLIWEQQFLTVLKKIELDKEELVYVEEVFKIFHKQ